MIKIFYVLINRNTLEYLKEDGYTSYKLEEALKFSYVKDAVVHSMKTLNEIAQSDFLVFKVELQYTLERVDTKIIKEYIKLDEERYDK